MKFSLSRFFYKLCVSVEKRVTYLCGKGYGSATIAQEVRMVSSLLGRKPLELYRKTITIDCVFFKAPPLFRDKACLRACRCM